MGQAAPEQFRSRLYDTGNDSSHPESPISIMILPSSCHLDSPLLKIVLSVNLAAGTAVYLSTPRAGFLAGRFVFSNWDMEQLERLEDQIVSEDLLKSRIRFGEQLDNAVIPPKAT